MNRCLFARRILAIVVFVVVSGCVSPHGVRMMPSPGVDRIPSTVAMHALLSNTGSEVRRGALMATPNLSRSEIYLAPPAESKLAVTPSSQMLTGELSAQMAHYGFDLRELPYEVRESYGPDGDDAYVISLALLDEMRERHGLETVIVGNAFFARGAMHQPSEMRIVAAYLKVIDTKTLEVLCQVNMPYDAYGREMSDLADSMAYQLATMAGLIK